MASSRPKQALKRGVRTAFSPDMRAFLRDLIRFSGRGGATTAGLIAGGAVVEGLGLALLVPLLMVIFGAAATGGRLERATAAVFAWAGVETPLAKLTLLLAAYVALMTLRAAVLYLRDIRTAALQAGFVEDLRAQIVARLAATPWQRLARLRHARITHVMSGDIQRVGVATHILLRLGVNLVMLIAQCVLVFLLAPLLAAVTLALLTLTALAYVPVTRRAHAVGGMVANQNLALLNATTQFLGGLKLAIGANLQGSFVTEFRDTLRGLTQRQVAFQRQAIKARLALGALSGIVGGLLVLIGFGAFHVAPATLITLLYVIVRMSRLAGVIQQEGQQFAFALPAYGVIKRLEHELADIPPQRTGATPRPALANGAIVFDAVTYMYDADGTDGAPRGVRDVTLTIMPGEFVGIAGPSGAGKTTFADLLVGLAHPQAGRVTVAGVPLAGAALDAWRERVSYIAQDPFLFHDTVRRNLAWVNRQASERDMWDALELAGAAAMVRGMEHGLDTMVGERGTLVSGGERQRLALARALLRKPRLLILDEATGAIDVAGERDILARLEALTPRPTIFVIAHRG